MSLSCGATGPSLPTAVSITVTPATPSIAGVTQVGFQANAQGAVDPSLSYAWDLGDGAAANGVATTHVFPRAGVFPVQVTVSNSKGASITTTATVEVRSLAGLWEPSFFVNFCFRIQVTHVGSSITMVTTNGSPILSQVSHPRNIDLSIAAATNFNCGALRTSSGSFDPTLDSFTVGGFGGLNQTETWRRLPN